MVCIKKTIIKWSFILIISVIAITAAYSLLSNIFFKETNTLIAGFDKSDVTLVYKNHLEYETNFALKDNLTGWFKAGTLYTKTTGYAYFSIKRDFDIHANGSALTLILHDFAYDGFDELNLDYEVDSIHPKTHIRTEDLKELRKKIREKTDNYILNHYIQGREDEIKEQIALRLYKKLNEKYDEIAFHIKWKN